MADIVPQELRDAPRGRAIERLYPIGVRDRMPLIIAVCVDGSLWQLDQQQCHPAWERLPSIPDGDAGQDDAQK